MKGAYANLNGQYDCEASSDRWVRTDGLRVIRQGKGVTCPPQWLPVLLASHQSAPPTRRRRRLVDNVFTSTAGLRTAAKEYNTNEPTPPPPAPPPPSPPPFTFTSTASLKTAVQAYNDDAASALATYGPVADWGVSDVTDMYELFDNLQNFNADISNWVTSSVTNMNQMFRVRSARTLCPQPL